MSWDISLIWDIFNDHRQKWTKTTLNLVKWYLVSTIFPYDSTNFHETKKPSEKQRQRKKTFVVDTE